MLKNSRLYRWSLRASWTMLLLLSLTVLTRFYYGHSPESLFTTQLLVWHENPGGAEAGLSFSHSTGMYDANGQSVSQTLDREVNRDRWLWRHHEYVYSSGGDVSTLTIRPWVLCPIFAILPVIHFCSGLGRPRIKRKNKQIWIELIRRKRTRQPPAKISDTCWFRCSFRAACAALAISILLTSLCLVPRSWSVIFAHPIAVGFEQGGFVVWNDPASFPYFNGTLQINGRPVLANNHRLLIPYFAHLRIGQYQGQPLYWALRLWSWYQLPIFAALVAAHVLFRRYENRWIPGLCVKCRYDLRGNPDAITCSECGTTRPQRLEAAP